MNLLVIICIIILAFVCEYLDSSLGMGYGTILSPLLLIFGFDPLIIIPSILISQSLAGFVASIFHHKLGNANFNIKQKDLKISLVIITFGLSASILAVFVSISIDIIFIKTYISILVLVVGSILLLNRKFNFSWKKIMGISVISAFNKSLSGGGFGPIVTSGQIISGNDSKCSIGITTFTEAPICICGFITYFLLNGIIDPVIPIIMTFGALLATPLGAFSTMKLNEKKGRKIVGILTIILGVFILFKIFI